MDTLIRRNMVKQTMRLKVLFIGCLLPLVIYAQPQGRIELSRFSINPDQPDQKVELKTQIWYIGNMSIQEVPEMESITDSLGTRIKTFVKYYLFINAEKKLYQYYECFADTARLVARSNTDDILAKRGGWNIYSNKKFEYDARGKLADTVITGKRLSRYTFMKDRERKTYEFILYSSCENKNEPIKYLKPFSEEIGCPVVRMDTYYNGQLAGVTELRYVTNTLSAKEREIFRIWSQVSKNF